MFDNIEINYAKKKYLDFLEYLFVSEVIANYTSTLYIYFKVTSTLFLKMSVIHFTTMLCIKEYIKIFFSPVV